MVSPGDNVNRAATIMFARLNFPSMKKILSKLGFYDIPLKPNTIPSQVKQRPLDMHDFQKWCRDLHVGRMANRNGEVVLRIGNHEKHVVFELPNRF